MNKFSKLSTLAAQTAYDFVIFSFKHQDLFRFSNFPVRNIFQQGLAINKTAVAKVALAVKIHEFYE